MAERDAEYAKWVTSAENKTKSEFVIRLILSQVDSARAKLVNIFLSDHPIFQVVSPANLAQVAAQYTAIYESDSAHYGWKSELSVALFDGLKYNLQAAEVDWLLDTVYSTETANIFNDASNAAKSKIVYQGNSIKRIDLYNAFWDTTVLPKNVHKHGDYAGYSELVTPVRLNKLLVANDISTALRTEIYESKKDTTLFKYDTPQIAKWGSAISPEESAANFDVPEAALRKGKMMLTTGTSIVTTMYERLIPADYGIAIASGIKNPTEQCIMKFKVVNSKYIVSAEQLTNEHMYLPIVFGQPLDEGLGYQSKSFSHNLEELQDVASLLVTSEIKSTRRMLTDRGIYDPMLLNKRDISSPNPSAKIPLRASGIGRNISDAYYPIPYEDRAMGSRMQQAMGLLSFGNETTGLNPVGQGQFVKGNKTNSQFQESMGASGQRMLSLAINLEDSFFSAIKEITKANILQFQQPDKVLSAILKQEIQINPEELKQLNPAFKISDGLISADRLANAEALTGALQIISQAPELAMQYNVPNMIVHLLNIQGIKDMQQYKLSDEEVKAKQAQMMQQEQAKKGIPPNGSSQQPA